VTPENRPDIIVNMSYLDDLQNIPTQRIWGDMTARGIQGKNLTLGILDLEPNGRVPEHHHEAEQIGVCIKGSITWIAGGETRELKPGATWHFPANVPHECYAGPDGAILIEGFSPLVSLIGSTSRSSPRLL